MNTRSLIIAGASLALGSLAFAAPGQIILRQTLLGPMPADARQLSIAPDGSRVGLVANAGTRQVVFIDGNKGTPYSTIAQLPGMGQGHSAPPFGMMSADLSLVAYGATRGGSEWVVVVNQKEGPAFEAITAATFAPAGHRLAYVARRGGQQFVVVDSSVSPGYLNVMANQLWFSADGQHVGYLAQTAGGQNPWHAVVDGNAGPGYGSVSALQLSHSGGHFACVTGVSGATDVNVVVDGKPGPAFAVVQSVVFSEDGKHVAYVAGRKGNPIKWVAVIDGHAGPEFDQLSNVVFSPDGLRAAYAGMAVNGNRSRWYAVIDGKKSLDYDSCANFLVSSDSRHLAYLASNGQKSVVVLDGSESDAHQMIDPRSIHFSPDGTRLGFVAQDENVWHAVVDGKTGPAHGVIDVKSFQFSPDGRHFRFKVRAGSTWTVVVDDLPAGATPAPSELVTSDDGRHTATVVTQNPEQSSPETHVRLDGKPVGQTYAGVDQLQLSPDGRRVAFACVKVDEPGKNLIQVVIDGHGGPGFMRITKILFSPDSRHVAYVGWENSVKQYVVVDGFQGPDYDQVLAGVAYSLGGMQFRPDGSLDFLAAKDGKLNRLVLGADAMAALSQPAAGGGGAAPGYSEIYAFGQVEHDGAKPAILTAAPDGTLFGATSAGGQYRYGVLFTVKPDGSNYTILHQFLGNQTDGSNPTSLLVGPDGAVYGALQNGGGSYGAIFRVAADGSGYAIIHGFSGNRDGGHAVLAAIDQDGTLYGMSRNVNMTPTYLFHLKPDGSDFTVFCQTQGQGPKAKGVGPYVDGSDGCFYGVSNNTLFKISKDGSNYSVIRTFEGRPLDTNAPDYAPISGSGRLLYGAASAGGQSSGVIYKLGRDGSSYKVIVNPTQALQPSGLAQGPDGQLYALVREGIVRFNPDGSDWTVLRPMDGSYFTHTLVAHDGALYGMTVYGGKGGGTIFRYGLSGGGAASAAPTVIIQNVAPTPLASD